MFNELSPIAAGMGNDYLDCRRAYRKLKGSLCQTVFHVTLAVRTRHAHCNWRDNSSVQLGTVGQGLFILEGLALHSLK